ncbi:MAG: nucleotide exchange factor GrpE [Chloroflexota bacterium]
MSDEKRTPGDAPQPPHAPDAEASSATTELDQLRKELDDARAKGQTYLDLAQRAQADFVNYKRRIEQERSDFARNARADTILKVLPTLDDLERAVQSLPPALAESDWAQGIALIERKLRAVLESQGIKRIEAIGEPFDPWKEEALAHEPSVQFPAGTVSRVYRSGYTLDGKVIRPAQVVVSSGPASEQSQPQAPNSAEGSGQI